MQAGEIKFLPFGFKRSIMPNCTCTGRIIDAKHRNKRGASFVLSIVLMYLIVLPMLLVGHQIGLLLTRRQEAQTLVEGAGLLAANDLSRITINDSHFGYVALSNFPPIGKQVCAPDGAPLPVIGINTLLGTVRQNALIAHELQNQDMKLLVEEDKAALDSTIERLNETLWYSLGEYRKDKKAPVDINGLAVNPVGDVTSFLIEHMPANLELVSVRLSPGWLANGGTTTVPVTKLDPSTLVQNRNAEKQNYPAFVDLPVDNLSFSFAGLGSNSTLVNPYEFRDADDEHICSVVRIECTFEVKDTSFPSQITCTACCQPFTKPDSTVNGAMTLRLPGGPAPGLRSWNDFLKRRSFMDRQVISYDVIGGDYPLNMNARLKQSDPQVASGTAQQFAQHLYFWLRSGHLRPRADAVLAMLDEPFVSGNNQVYVYKFETNGDISRTIVHGNIFPPPIISDKQFSVVADTSTNSGLNPIIIFRDNVMKLGTTYGGQHCGQPLAGYPLTEQELGGCRNWDQLAFMFSQRGTYSRGLALDIEVGGTSSSSDIVSMRPIPKGRKI